ncbi:hypothetical protein JVT61DRAFT_6715 [Boletus reticuloceps]|uniref:HCP-like protein n=1 Tax=Boletus reticuloceps TaxID=495285 RepID=A0A8I3A7K0_9AGAM|nr:hypothetical protein JVT61DRAFT_6715 [Boletus reticuloceps]
MPETSGHSSHLGRLLHSSPLDTFVRRTSSRRQVTKQQIHTSQDNASTLAPPSLRPHYTFPQLSAYAASPPRPQVSQRVPDSPLLHSHFRSSTASAATNTIALHTSQNSKSFLSFADDCEPGDGCYEGDNYYGGQRLQPSESSNHHHYFNNYPTSAIPSASTQPESQTDLWDGPTQPPSLNYIDNLMHPPPSTLPTVIVSTPQDDCPWPYGPMRQPIVSQSGSPRLNFSRPGRPPILSSEEQKRHVLERNAQRPNSPRANSSQASLSPVTPVTASFVAHRLHHRIFTLTGYTQSPSLASSNHVMLSSHQPSLRAGSRLSLYSNSYSYYELGSAAPSPSPTPTTPSPRSSPDVSPPTSRSVSTEPQTPEEYLQLGIQYHEANQLKDSAVCFEKSAMEQGGCGVGMLMWGLTLRHGWGCEKNEKSGFKWLTKAAESAVQDLEKAKKGLEVKGVKEELVLAIYEVGQCFFQGWGVAKDQKMAVSYYRVAAKLGDADAQQDLAFCLANARGCKKDKKEAAKWYRAAVAQGVSDVGMAWIYKDKYKD